MTVDLTKHHRCRVIAVPQSICRACGAIGPLAGMRPVDPGAGADLGSVLSGMLMCADKKACLNRYTARSKGDTVLVVVLPAEEWASGTAMVWTFNPRRAHEHAAAMGACVVPLRIDADYRKV